MTGTRAKNFPFDHKKKDFSWSNVLFTQKQILSVRYVSSLLYSRNKAAKLSVLKADSSAAREWSASRQRYVAPYVRCDEH
jgi:hypothetical protein